jgi:hypothetical protein
MPNCFSSIRSASESAPTPGKRIYGGTKHAGGAGERVPGVVDENVQTVGGDVGHGFHGPADRVWIAQVQLDRDHGAGCLASELRQPVHAPRGRQHRVSFAGRSDSGGSADAAAGARDQDRLAHGALAFTRST